MPQVGIDEQNLVARIGLQGCERQCNRRLALTCGGRRHLDDLRRMVHVGHLNSATERPDRLAVSRQWLYGWVVGERYHLAVDRQVARAHMTDRAPERKSKHLLDLLRSGKAGVE